MTIRRRGRPVRTAVGPRSCFIRPETNPDPSNPANWRASTIVGGSPGSYDGLRYTDWATALNVTDLVGTADDDNDGISNLFEYALGLSPKFSSDTLLPFTQIQTLNVNGTVSNYLTLTFTRAIGRDDVNYAVEATSNLGGAWTSAVPVGSPTFNGNQTETLVYRHPQATMGQSLQLLRLRVTR